MAGDATPPEGFPDQEHLLLEAEEFMRQGRYQDAVSRYSALRRRSPIDPLVFLGHASALECAGDIGRAEQVIEEAAGHHKTNSHVQRFRQMFFVRREDYGRARLCREALANIDTLESGPREQLAELYFNQGRYHEALSEVDRILRDDRPDGDELRANLLSRRGACLRQEGRLEEAREDLLGALALDGGNAWTISELAEVERGLGNPEGARRRYLEALERNPEDHWCRGHLAQLEAESGRVDRAVAIYEEVLAASPHALWAKIDLAQILEGRDPRRSTTLCEEVLARDPAYPWAYTQLAVLARNRGDHERARQHYQQAVAAAPDATWILLDLADSCRRAGRMEEAYTHLEHARNRSPFDPTTYGFTADFLRDENRIDEAIPNLRKAVEFDPDYAWAWRELTELLAIKRDWRGSDEAYAEVERIEPEEPTNAGLKAFVLRRQGRLEDAIPYLRQAVERMPDYRWAWRELAEVLLRLERTEEALAALARGIERNPDQANLLVMRAEALRQLGRREEALAAVTRGLEIDDRIAHLWAIRAELVLEGSPEEALVYAERAERLGEGPEFKLLMAQVLIHDERTDEAMAKLTPLLDGTDPPENAYDLAVEVLLRRGDAEAARDVATSGLEAHPDNPRLPVKLALIEVRTGRGPGAGRLGDIWDRPLMGVPWREVAEVFAAAGEVACCRRACDRFVSQARRSPHNEAGAWVFWAEQELVFGFPREARSCLEQALAADAEHVNARLLLAMLAEHEHDYQGALEQFERIRAAHPERFTPAADDGLNMVSQYCSLNEIAGRHEVARGYWQLILDSQSASPEATINASRYLVRQRLPDEALALLRRRSRHAGGDERLLREQALVMLREGRAADATELLCARCAEDPAVDEDTAVLAVQLCLNGGAIPRALELLDALESESDLRRLRVLRIRCLLAAGRAADAVELAEALRDDAGGDEELATLLAEAVSYGGAYRRALAIVTDPELPRGRSLERLLLGACLHLEVNGVAHCLTWLGQREPTARELDTPLVRILACAWPDAWGAGCRPARLADIPALPPFPRAARRLARALHDAGDRRLAAQLLTAVADALRQQERPATARQLFYLAVPLWRSAGSRLRALSCALAARSAWAVLLAILPGATLLPWPRSLSPA